MHPIHFPWGMIVSHDEDIETFQGNLPLLVYFNDQMSVVLFVVLNLKV